MVHSIVCSVCTGSLVSCCALCGVRVCVVLCRVRVCVVLCGVRVRVVWGEGVWGDGAPLLPVVQ